ncbi:hypothetical protein DFH06DRAFT_1472509 [Mycena polygramma]|nr:hypothetical protein DFH06DRAFT_1472509 [Mycena polygramma]
MHNSLSSSLLLALCTIAAAPSSIAVALQQRAIGACQQFSLDDSTLILTALCGNAEQLSIGKLALNPCVGNNNGNLVPGSDFGGSCSGIIFGGEGPFGPIDGLSANCTSQSGVIVTSVIPSERFISGQATLQCP